MSESMKIVTYNIRCAWNWDGINSFIHRGGMLWKTVKEESPDVIAFQEVTEQILELLKDLMPDYLIVGQGRNADYKGEGLYTAIKKSSMDLLGLETFWLGPEPFTPASKFDDKTPCLRICVSTMVRHKATNKIMRLYNVHLDNVSIKSRVGGIKCVLDQAQISYNRTPMPFVILGDFNDRPDSSVIDFCNNEAFTKIKDVACDILSTYHEYGKLQDVKIDYMFMTEDIANKVTDVSAWDFTMNGIYLSDHYPICATLDIE